MPKAAYTLAVVILAGVLLLTADIGITTAQGPNGRPEIWGDCELFDGVVAQGTFKPSAGNFDELYAGATFKDGVGLISESKPGDTDYNGGRWHLNVLKGGVDPNKYANACSVEDLDLNDFESTGDYFSCPMLPRPGSR